MPTPANATIWIQQADEAAPVPRATSTPLSLTANGVEPLAWHAEPAADAVWLAPVATRAGPAVALIVPDALARAVTHGGVPLGAGLFVVRHGERIDVEGVAVWVSTHGDARTANYDPAVHGPDRFCARTKARLAPGEPVVSCPGKPGRPCGELHREAAWRRDAPCAHCGTDPRAPAWQPPTPPARGTLDELRSLTRR